jgi:microcompartment protein CcmL/EutN
MKKSIGLVEFRGIAKGIEASDAMMKAADVRLIQSLPLCPGKYVILIAGEVGAVENAVAAGINVGKEQVVDKLILPNVHFQVFPALTGTVEIKEYKSLGIIEVFSVAAAIKAGDAAVKASTVELMEIRLARGMGGKAFIFINGDVSAVKTAVQKGVDEIKDEGWLLNYSVIPSPNKELLAQLV